MAQLVCCDCNITSTSTNVEASSSDICLGVPDWLRHPLVLRLVQTVDFSFPCRLIAILWMKPFTVQIDRLQPPRNN